MILVNLLVIQKKEVWFLIINELESSNLKKKKKFNDRFYSIQESFKNQQRLKTKKGRAF